MELMTTILALVGLGLLIVGAEALVRGASGLAERLGIPHLIVGLTVVAFGTSSPEFAVSLHGAVSGQANVAVGNVLGSNLFNILVILGLSAAVTPLTVGLRLVRIDVPIMLAVTAAVGALLVIDGNLGRIDGAILAAAAVLYTLFTIRQSGATDDEELGPDDSTHSVAREIAMAVVGLGLLILGARWFVAGAVELATVAGVDPLIISLTIVAAGTSLPELATSVMAARRSRTDIAVGNVVGSNIMNLLAVLGFSALLAPKGLVPAGQAIAFDLPVVFGASVACLPIFFTNYTVDRWEGILFLFYYAVYVGYLAMAATRHPWLGWLTDAMLFFVLPLTAVTLIVIAIRR